MNPTIYRVVVVPTLVTEAAFIAITTLGDKVNNFVNRLLAARKSNGTPIFKHIHFDLVCNTCKKKGLVDECIHQLGDLPRWMSKSR